MNKNIDIFNAIQITENRNAAYIKIGKKLMQKYKNITEGSNDVLN